MPNYQITCETPNAEIRYTIDGSEPNQNSTLYSGAFSSDILPRAKAWADGYRESRLGVIPVGTTLTIDDVEVFVIYAQNGINIAVDKNHNLSYYISGNDYASYSLPVDDVKYGYEWGGYKTASGIQSTYIGSGLTNTNALIGMNLQSDTAGWYVVWDKVREFKNSHSDNWFVPSKDELKLVWENQNKLLNLSGNYWTSSEYSGSNSKTLAYCKPFISYDTYAGYHKNDHSCQTRLCVIL